jgi:hypothetical protein
MFVISLQYMALFSLIHNYMYMYIYIYIYIDYYDTCVGMTTVSRRSVGREGTHDRKISVVNSTLIPVYRKVDDVVPCSSLSYLSMYVNLYIYIYK